MIEASALANYVAYRMGQTAAKNGVPVAPDGRPLVNMSVGKFYNELLLWTGVLDGSVKKEEYLVIIKSLIAQYTEGYFSIPEADRIAARELADREEAADRTAEQAVVDLIHKHFPGSIVVPL